MTKGIELIAQERTRQIEEEEFDAMRDAQYTDGELCKAAIMYGSVPIMRIEAANNNMPEAEREEYIKNIPEDLWPWDKAWWKPGTDTQCLIKAGALIAAELDRRIAEEERNGKA